MAAHSNENEPPAEFLAKLAETLSRQNGGDGELAAILGAHLLNEKITPESVAKAKSAIAALATQRAKAALQERANG